MKKTVVLAFSGGLDTSYCAMYLSKELGYDVTAVTVNTGGFTPSDKSSLERKARALGVSDYRFIDDTETYYRQGVKYLLFGNVLKNNTYPLSVSAERVFQASRIAEFAKNMQADAIAHGSTGAGNDQIRFDMIFQSICPNAEIITPIRDQSLSRTDEIEYLIDNGVVEDWEASLYSINQGLWGTSVGGKETLTSDMPLPEKAYPSQLLKKGDEIAKIQFEKGEPVALNGFSDKPYRIIEKLNALGGSYAIGRDIHVGDTIIGIKGRVGFEAPAAAILIKAHHTLEKHVLSKYQLMIKEQFASWYGNLMHEGNFLDPAMRDMEALLDSSQQHVSGVVTVKLMPYTFQVQGVSSQHDLMQSNVAHYGETNKGWSAADVRGFAKIYANQMKIYNSIHEDEL
jgi:argininosuccinate synthase